MKRVINTNAYRFITLDKLETRKIHLKHQCEQLDLMGTILIASEGINLMLAGDRENIEKFKAYLDQDPATANLEYKETVSETVPFKRLRVRIKEEIITMGVDAVAPAKETAPHIDANTFKQWLDEGKEIAILDTRNDYELEFGKFENAIDLDIHNFSEFPDAIKTLPEELKKKPVVMYCTGGIRCEKAGAHMQAEGFEQVYQLEGGIVKYFEECGGAHYDGDCFIFDERVSLNANLEETGACICEACSRPMEQAQTECGFCHTVC